MKKQSGIDLNDDDKPVEPNRMAAYNREEVILWLQGIEAGSLSLQSDNLGLAAAALGFLQEDEEADHDGSAE